jgi:hypothetical protein
MVTQTLLTYGGMAVVFGGAFFGLFRGKSLYTKLNTQTARGFDGNPLDHVSFNIVPGVGGGLLYTTSF